MIAIRAATSDDASAIAAIYAPHVLTGTVSFENDPPDARAMRTRMAASDGLYPWLVATTGGSGGGEPDGGVIGYAYATRFRDRPAYRYVCETSIYLTDASSGSGVGRLLYKALVDTLRAQGFVHAIGAIALPNDRSIRLHEAVGFRRAGVYREVGFKHGQWIDVGFWQAELNEPSVPPVEPRKFSDVGVVRG
ncbi:MAG: N-acetyltransferase [Sphingomonas sp.]|uniref:GNAT family N-acetyltransferase n=1 Tax=Sphingomonas sp. TaxID=28214 RepID=UPI0025F0F84A|nr:GNAT family N-acetyltransferase [Sphingomonas sp.]MBX3563215.1 N-acetyltransferase [Sphingomonas sp.]